MQYGKLKALLDDFETRPWMRRQRAGQGGERGPASCRARGRRPASGRRGGTVRQGKVRGPASSAVTLLLSCRTASKGMRDTLPPTADRKGPSVESRSLRRSSPLCLSALSVELSPSAPSASWISAPSLRWRSPPAPSASRPSASTRPSAATHTFRAPNKAPPRAPQAHAAQPVSPVTPTRHIQPSCSTWSWAWPSRFRGPGTWCRTPGKTPQRRAAPPRLPGPQVAPRPHRAPPLAGTPVHHRQQPIERERPSRHPACPPSPAEGGKLE